ncbi:hypothetical protein T484DRAFT_1757375 [Baffinella frigidus]|nr:hypothetical protein T484DRAFT_1757375 [Cryptophyta sp. CCMP2293]
MWSLANKVVLEATTAHAMKSVDEQTPPRIGVVLARATTMDFENLGALVTTVTEIFNTKPGDDNTPTPDEESTQDDSKDNTPTDSGDDEPPPTDSGDDEPTPTDSGDTHTKPHKCGDTPHTHTKSHECGDTPHTHTKPHKRGDTSHISSNVKKAGPDHNAIADLSAKETGHMRGVKPVGSSVYNLTVVDTHGLSYMTEVRMDESMRESVSGRSKVPMALHALRNLNGSSDAFDNDVSEVRTLMEKAFGGDCSMVCKTTNTPHTVGGAGLGMVRTFPTDLESQSVLSTESATTSLFNGNRVPTHTVVVHSTRVSGSKPIDRYMALQSVTIEEVGGIYTASVVMTRSAMAQGGDIDDNVYMAAPQVPFERSDTHTPRSSDVHVFTAGRHFTANVLHSHDSDAPRSLQLPVYAVMHAITQMHPNLTVYMKHAMCVGSMETLHTDASTPLVVMRDSVMPLVAVFAAHPEKEETNQPHMLDIPDTFEITEDEEWEKFLCEHARHARIQDASRSHCKQPADMSQKAEHEESGCGPDQEDDSYGDNALTTRTRGMYTEHGMHDGMYTGQATRDGMDTGQATRGVVYPENVRMALMRHWNK